MPAHKDTIGWYQNRLDKGTITLEEMQEYQKKLQEEAAKKQKAFDDAQKEVDDLAMKIKAKEEEERQQMLKDLGMAIVEKFGDKVTVDDLITKEEADKQTKTIYALKPQERDAFKDIFKYLSLLHDETGRTVIDAVKAQRNKSWNVIAPLVGVK